MRKSLAGLAVAAITVGMLVAAGSSPAGAALPDYTCNGGADFFHAVTVPSGVYQSLTINGFCATDEAPGVVEVHGLVKLMPGSALDAGEGGTAKLWVQNNVLVGKDAFLNLGCGGPDGGGGGATAASLPLDCTADYLNGAILANGALGVVTHGIQVRGDVSIQGGGGGVNCDPPELLVVFPAYSTLEDDIINGAVNITGLNSCWLGVIRNHIRGDVTIKNNIFDEEDANEVVDNVLNNRLMCTGNSPGAQVGDSFGGPNHVRGVATGECAALKA